MRVLAAVILLVSVNRTYGAIQLADGLIDTIASTQITDLSSATQPPENDVFRELVSVPPSGLTESADFSANTRALGFELSSAVTSDFTFTPTGPLKITASASGNTSAHITGANLASYGGSSQSLFISNLKFFVDVAESLNTQRSQIASDVKRLGGKIVAWYGGQEHATPGHEKGEVDRLVRDAPKNKFDAVMVAHQDRWSRDNAKSKAGIKTFREHGIRFFVRTFECDLNNPTHRFQLAMSAEIGELQAATQNQKSLENRIERAKKGFPACGKRPPCRVFDKKTETWEIDKDKHAMVKDVAKRYLAGEPMSGLADEYGVNHSNLHKILTKRCGEDWIQTFDSDELNIHEVVVTKVPKLLPESTIKAIQKKVAANKTYSHGQIKNKYLLSRMVFCDHCGYAMFGQTNRQEHRYYRHAHHKRARPCKCTKCWIPADDLEVTVLVHLFEMFGNPKAIERAIEEAVPDREGIDDLREQKKRLEGSLEKVRKGKSRVVRLVIDGTLNDAEVERDIDELRRQEARQQNQLRKINDQLEQIPSAKDIRAVSHDLSAQIKRAMFPIGRRGQRKVPSLDGEFVDTGLWVKFLAADDDFKGMSYADKRALVEAVFCGATPDGKRAGVYIRWDDGDNDGPKWRFSIRGIIQREKLAPCRAEALESYFDDPDKDGFDRGKSVRTKCASH